MYVHVATVKRKTKTYRYVQLVESFRRKPDGMPAHRVVANLGTLSEQEVANLRVALAASRKGHSVVLPKEIVHKPAPGSVTDNLHYLDVAVALELWRQWQLDELFDELLPAGEEQITPALIVTALTIHRCVDPGSKLHAQRWFPRTALPELLGIAAGQFHNTRIHRVLSALEKVTPRLQEELPKRYTVREGAFAVLFVDTTDTWFFGQGPSLAQEGKTKEGMYRRKIGIVLLCNEYGYPVRWEVYPGRENDSLPMGRLLGGLESVSWVGKAPLVFDRAMGKSKHLREVSGAGLRFVTALTETEYEAYTGEEIPHHALTDLDVWAPDAEARAAAAVEDAGMNRASDELYLRDVGIVERSDPDYRPLVKARKEHFHPITAREALYKARQLQALLEEGAAASRAEAGRQLGMGPDQSVRVMKLLQLTPEIQQEISEGRVEGVGIEAILRLVTLYKSEEQSVHLARLKESDKNRPNPAARRESRRRDNHKGNDVDKTLPKAILVRAVVCFNPAQFVGQRRRASKTLANLEQFVNELNARLASGRSRQSKASAQAEVVEKLRRRNVQDVFEVWVQEIAMGEGRKRLKVQLHRKDGVWNKRRRYDGFNVIVAHPDVLLSAGNLVDLYYSKDQIEKDFHVIKSVIQLRPVRHRKNPKVRAHVTLCMLALLLERTLERRLKGTPGEAMTAESVFELLSNIHLNRIQAPQSSTAAYTLTRLSPEQQGVLKALEMADLADEGEMLEKITRR